MKSLIVFIYLFWCTVCEETSENQINLEELSKNITETIQNPSGDIEVLNENIYKYYTALEIMHKDMKKGVKEALDAFNELKNHGGPSFLKLLPVEEKPLIEFYKWQRYQGIEFRGFLKYNEDEWIAMNELVNKDNTQDNH